MLNNMPKMRVFVLGQDLSTTGSYIRKLRLLVSLNMAFPYV